MGLLADFYIAEKKAATDYDNTQAYAEEDRVQSKGLTPLELSTLGAILDGKEWEVDMMDAFEAVLIVDGGERMIHEISPALVDRLSSLSDSEVESAAALWAATEEISCNPGEIRPLIEALVRLAERAKETHRQLFLWNCV